MELYFGPGGIPLSCKGRTFLDGIEDVHMLGLEAMEVQLVRGIGADIQGLDIVKKAAKELGIQLSVHAPYYIDLARNKESVDSSIEKVVWCGRVAEQIGAKAVITHLGPYWQYTRKTAAERITENVRYIRDAFKREGIKAKLGIEPSGRQNIFGSMEEILAICKRVSNTMPVISFHHIHARENGSLKKKEDYEALFESVREVTRSKNFYTTFAGVEYADGNELRMTPIKKGDLKFETLAECILDNNYNMTIISNSPLLEHDSMYMKVILERVKMKKEVKAIKKETKDAPEEKSTKKSSEEKPAKKATEQKTSKKAKK